MRPHWRYHDAISLSDFPILRPLRALATLHRPTHRWTGFEVLSVPLTWRVSCYRFLSRSVIVEHLPSVLARCRASLREQRRWCRELNVPVPPTLTAPDELECLEGLVLACPVPVILQYPVETYRLDAMIPEWNLGIEIDEDTHRYYDETADSDRSMTIAAAGITVLRFPANVGPMNLVRTVWTHRNSSSHP